MSKIAVIGAGVNGLTCAVKIKETYKDFDVVLISSEFSPNTTGDGSGGLWLPYLCGNTPYSLIEKWGGLTYKFFHEQWKTGAHGVCMEPIYYLYRTKEKFVRPEWARMVFGYHELDSKELEDYSQLFSGKYTAGHTFTTFVCSPSALLAHFQQRFQQANGRVLQAKLTSLQDPLLAQYDVVVNCTGLGARFLVPDDTVVPIRGQVLRVIAPWINQVIIDGEGGNYIIPNSETVVLGGTSQKDFNTEVDPKDTDFILNGCKRIMPGLERAEIVNHWAGLRPSRDSVRLEPEEKNGKLYIHNYGHGGSGFTLFWGCGEEVLQILQKYLNKNTKLYGNSKL
ncbi:hypothetical protein PYW07_002613 [Mythimna separata]|uniref:FAD dependent oxidoreductase domain-containing protein n=1 Tax=Mythimna separata TaxID=271217 RepID=A0AAD7YGM6_MYTSE|nr:hypothetical protein PYW07_002613 [Mythimna separata]